jgi:hypothetical protein
MSHEVLVPNEQVRNSTTEVPSPELLDRIVESVRRDSQQAATEFLAETVVHHGGE